MSYVRLITVVYFFSVDFIIYLLSVAEEYSHITSRDQ